MAGRVPRTLGLTDLVLLGAVAIVNVNTVPPVAGLGRAAVLLWVVAFLAFYVPDAIAVMALSRRYPGEGGVYLWARRQFGDVHGFLAGWCYWTNNLLYVPVLLVYIAGVAAFAGGARTAGLVDNPWFVAGLAYGWLALMTVAHVRGMAVGKWVNNAGGIGALVTVALVAVAALIARGAGVAETPPAVEGTALDLAGGLGVACFAYIGIELAATMSDEIKRPERDLPRATIIVGLIAVGSYVLVTEALLALVPAGEMGAIQGVMQAVAAGATAAGAEWLVAPVAVVMAVAIGGATSAWFAGPARIPFVAGFDRALPEALGRVHPTWGSPHVALITCAIVSGIFTAISLTGSTVAEAYQVLLRASVVINLVPFVYLFLGLTRLPGEAAWKRAAGGLGMLVTLAGIVTAFVPGRDVESVLVFELKMAAGVLAPIGIGLWLFARSRRTQSPEPKAQSPEPRA
ncbi:MAG: APC family permease [Acidobacteriota bacterium]